MASSACVLIYQLPTDNFILTIPLFGGVATSIDWGDGNFSYDNNRVHTYATAGTYTVQVMGSGIIMMDQAHDVQNSAVQYLIECSSFGEIGLTSLDYAFWRCSALTTVPALLPAGSNITTMAHTFDSATAMNSDLHQWDVSYVTNMSGMFTDATAFNNGDSGNNGNIVLNWGNKTQNVTDMSYMFNNASSFNQRINSFNVSSVTTMEGMFNGAILFNNGDPGNNQVHPIAWGTHTGNVTNMYSMFSNAYAFNQDISGWSTGSCTNMYAMFSSTTVFNQYLGSWDVSNVQDMGSMFSNARVFNNGDLGNNQGHPLAWTTSQVTNMNQIFQNAYVFNQDVSGWNVSAVQDMSGMFRRAYLFNQDLSAWVPSSSTSMYRMFRDATAFNNGDSGNNQNKPMTSWGSHLSNVQDMGQMFENATAFNQDVNNWDVSNVSYIEYMFYGATLFNQNLSTWNPTNASAVWGFLSGCATSITNYDALLNGWSQRTLQEGLYFSNMGLVYSSASSTARHLIETSYNWNIEGDIQTSVNPIPTNTNITFTITGNQNAMGDYLSAGHTYRLVDLSNNPVSGDIVLDGSVAYPTLIFTNVNFTTSGSHLLNLYDVTNSQNAGYDFPYNIIVSGGMACFKEGSKILTMEGYLPIEQLRKGDQVLTSRHGFKAINMIGKRVIDHVVSEERIKDQLYILSPSKYPELKEDLIITGCHSVLIDHFEEGEKEKTAIILGANYVTDGKYRLPACVDQRTSVYDKKGKYTIYHMALEHADYYMNYGVYANGLLVETTSKRYMKELSEMTLIE
uniref:PKD domain-containing protein n=1 Tax=viral metagenome TaxID=1070528 RepID=A0A6C0KVI1_9ZZZZ